MPGPATDRDAPATCRRTALRAGAMPACTAGRLKTRNRTGVAPRWAAPCLHGAPLRVCCARVAAAPGARALYPRIDPAVIMLVHCGPYALLGRQARWAPGRYSCLAGARRPAVLAAWSLIAVPSASCIRVSLRGCSQASCSSQICCAMRHPPLHISQAGVGHITRSLPSSSQQAGSVGFTLFVSRSIL